MTAETFRESYRKTEIGPIYSGWLHFGFTTTGALAVIAFAIAHIEAPTLIELGAIPFFFFFANVGEYLGHKGPMHRPQAGLRLLYERHTLQHHQFFTHQMMQAESPRDFKMVLFPPIMLFFFLGMLAGPPALLLYMLASHNLGLIFMAVGMSYFLTYEWLHFSYHLPPESFVGRLWLVRKLRAHHTHHHDKGLMGHYNFNITFPICDVLFGTYWTKTK